MTMKKDHNDDMRIIKAKLLRKVLENKEHNESYKKLFHAVRLNDIDQVSEMLRKNEGTVINPYNLKQLDDDQNTLLHIACKQGYYEIAELLIKSGFPVNSSNRKQHTPLHWAAHNEHFNIMGLLLNNDAEINPTDNEGDTPLVWTILRKKPQVSEYLLEKGASTNIYNTNGILPIHWAAYLGDIEHLKLLTQYSCNVFAKTIDGKTVRDCAAECGNKAVVEFIIEQEKSQH